MFKKGVYLDDQLVDEFNDLQSKLIDLNIRVGIRYRRLLRLKGMNAPDCIVNENESMLGEAVLDCNDADEKLTNWLSEHKDFSNALDKMNCYEQNPFEKIVAAIKKHSKK